MLKLLLIRVVVVFLGQTLVLASYRMLSRVPGEECGVMLVLKFTASNPGLWSVKICTS